MLINEFKTFYLYEGLNKSEIKSVQLWESAGRKLAEAQLTADQIQKLFQEIETTGTASGSNRTLLGKGMDAAGAVKKAYDDLVSKVQNSGPVKNVDALYDQAAEKLKQSTGGDDGVMKYVQKYRDFAKAHPIAQSLIYSALIAAAGITGAGAGGAVALGLFKMVDKLLQGEKFSTAVGKGAATGAMAYGASKLGDLVKGQPNPIDAKMASGLPNNIPLDPLTPRQEVYQTALKAVRDTIASGKTDSMSLRDAAASAVEKFGTNVGGKVHLQTLDILVDKAVMVGQVQLTREHIDRDTTIMTWALNESLGKPRGGIHLTEAGVKLLFTTIVTEAGMWDKVKGAAGAAANKLATVGKNLTTKVTADKLMTAWKNAGSPTDSNKIMQLLQTDFKINPEVIKQATEKVGIPSAALPAIPAPAAAPATTSPSPAIMRGGEKVIGSGSTDAAKASGTTPVKPTAVTARPATAATATTSDQAAQAATPAEQPAQAATPAEQPAQAATPAEQPAQAATPAAQPAQAATPAAQPAQAATPAEQKTVYDLKAEFDKMTPQNQQAVKDELLKLPVADDADDEPAPTTAQQQPPAAQQPQGTEADLDQVRQQTQSTRQAAQAQQQQAIQQMQTTAQANQATANTDAAIKAAADAAKAKPAFQQTASDKLAIKRAADKGIREEMKKQMIKKRKISESYAKDLEVFERFLSMPEHIAQPKVAEAKPETVAAPKPQGNDILDIWTKLKV
jgi:hypothetical protein